MIPIDSCPSLVTCPFDKTPTLSIITFEVFVIVGAIISLLFLSKLKNRIIQRFLIIAAGVFIFEAFTAPMWNNFKLGDWAYLYSDVSWILTIGWASMILMVVVIVDKFLATLSEWKRFGLYILVLMIVVYIAEAIVVKIGIRSYSPEVLEVIGDGPFIPILDLPVHGLYYIPVFISLIIGFYKYWSFEMDKRPIIPIKKGGLIRGLAITTVAIVLFELMIEPMVVNAKFPTWSYFYRDISFLMTGVWLIIIWLSIRIVDKVFIHLNLVKKFVLYITIGTIIFLPIESWFILNGYRIYGQSSVENFSGITTPITNLPIEIMFAVPFYLALIIAFTRYWEIIFDNKENE